MKKFLSIMLALVMVLSCSVCAHCEEEKPAELIPLEGMMIDVINASQMSASEWFQTAEGRALLSVLIAAALEEELGEETFPLSTTLINTSFVGKDETLLVIYLHGVDNDALVFYTPVLGTVRYAIQEPASDVLVSTALESITGDGCYKNDLEHIVKAVAAFSDAASKMS